MAAVFEQKIRALAAALEHEDLEQRGTVHAARLYRPNRDTAG